MKNVGLYENDLSVPRKKDLDEKQSAILAEGILKGDGAGGVSAAVANTDYATCTNLRNGKSNNSLVFKDQGPYNEGQYACSFAAGGDGASGFASFTNGANASASGNSSHAEGSSCHATGDQSHAEGLSTTGSGKGAHSEGKETSAVGDYSHAEGLGTVAKYRSQHTEGEFNIVDASPGTGKDAKGNYINIVGNGTSNNNLSNAHTLDWSGNAWFAGDVYVGSTSGTNKDAGSKKLITADEVPKGAVYTATLTAAGWVTSGAWKTQTVSVTGLKASYNAAPFVDVALSGTDAAADVELSKAWLGISASAIANTAANSLTVKFPATVDTPTVNIPIRVTTYD